MSRRHDGHPVRAVRNDDLGACGAFVTYEALARLVEEQFHPQIAGELFRDTGVDWIDSLQTRVDAGPWLRGVSFTTEDEVGMHFSVRASVEPFGTARINGLPWGDVYGQLRIGTVPVYTAEGGTVRAIEGARRLSVEGHFEAANEFYAGDDLLRRNISENIARGLQGVAASPGLGRDRGRSSSDYAAIATGSTSLLYRCAKYFQKPSNRWLS